MSTTPIVAILPQKASFKLLRHKGDLCDFSYTESFSDSTKEVGIATFKVLKTALAKDKRLKVSMTKGGQITIAARKIPYRMAASMIVGEFINWTALADMRIRDLIISASMSAAGVSVNDLPGGNIDDLRKFADKENC